VNRSMYEKSLELFLKEPKVKKENTVVIFEMISSGETGWENMLPDETTALIKEKKMFIR